MSSRRVLSILAVNLLACGATQLAQAGTAPKSPRPKPARDTIKPLPRKRPVARAVDGADPVLIGQYGTWGAYMATPKGEKICFALAKPTSSKTDPPKRPRDPVYAFVSTRPAEKVVNEVSIMIGYTLKPGSESTLEVGGANYAMYTQGDGIWIKNAAEEGRMVEAMRRSADVVVKAVSARGTRTTDIFSLRGFSQALEKVAQHCGR
ncbi:MAG: invasion associated locus B family protein [Bradyrhizobium sp.]